MSRPGTNVAHTLRRVVQTPSTFGNWPSLLVDMARGRPDVLKFRARSGLSIDVPNVRGARVPVYEIFAEDCYHLEWFVGPLRDRPIQVMDIGAHVGTFACRFAQLFPLARLDCYEPSPVTASFLRTNAAQNSMSDRVTVHEVAVTATSGAVELADNGGGSGLNGLVSAGHTAASSTRVESIAFDEAVAALAGPPELVKIDCEGGEYDFVYGSKPELWDTVRRVVLEYHPVPGQTWPELRAWFENIGLRVVKHEPHDDRLGSAWLSRDPLPAA